MYVNSNSIFTIASEVEFNSLALQIFRYQFSTHPIYRDWVTGLGIGLEDIQKYQDIPFLPISFFKSHRMYPGKEEPQLKFYSSGTTDDTPSVHEIPAADLYIQSFYTHFQVRFGLPDHYHILALLPSYLERGNSSLVYMLSHLIKEAGDVHSGFYLNQFPALYEKMSLLKNSHRKIMLWGVSYALLDFAESFNLNFPDAMIIETGGMKGKREELSRSAFHQKLQDGFGCNTIISEYGMTELLSQAYAMEQGVFYPAPWMKILIRDPYDPFHRIESGRSGLINIIDLANIHSCSFIATDDIGRQKSDGGFEVLGRSELSDVRGCNLLYS